MTFGLRLGLGLSCPHSVVSGGGGSAAAAGTSASTFAIAPTVQYHPNTATLTMRAPNNLTGYISGNTFTVLTNDGPPLMVDDVVVGAAAGTKIVRCGTAFGATMGSFTVDISQTVGSSGSPANFTVDTQTVLGIADLKGHADLTSLDGYGPRLMTDALGRKFMRFLMPETYKGSWLRNTSLGSLDTYNSTWILVGRFHNAGGSGCIVSYGLKETSTGSNAAPLQYRSGFPLFLNKTLPAQASPPANMNKLLLGTQLQVVGVSTATNLAVGTTTSTVGAQLMLNEQTATIAMSSQQATGKTGFEVGKLSTAATLVSGATYAIFDLYEMSGWLQGEMGNISQMPARASAAQATAVSNFNIPAITDSVILAGDSRSINGALAGRNIGIVMTDPGYSAALPATTRVINTAASGEGIGVMWQNLDLANDTNAASTVTSPLNASLMLGGGHDMVGIYSGINDFTGSNRWPNTSIGGRYAAGTANLADDLYNGADYTSSFVATIANNSTSMSVTGLTAPLYDGSKLTIPGTSPGLAVTGYSATGPFTLTSFQTPGVTGVSGTGVLQNFLKYVQALLQRGFKVRWAAETIYGGGDNPARAQFNNRIMNYAINDVTTSLGSSLAANLKVFDLTQIPVGGLKIFGADYTGSSATDPNWLDTTHPSPTGMKNLASGGDDPTKGYTYALTH